MVSGPENRFNLGTGQMTDAQARAAQMDMGLRAYMLQIYNYMASGLALTGIVALAVSQSPEMMQAIFGTPLAWVVMLSPLAFILVINFGVHKMKASTLQMVFWAFSGVMGLSMASIFLQFTGESIARTFFITAGTFAAMSLWGYTTKKDLSGMGSFLMMGLIGLIIAMVVNIFLQSSGLQFVISGIGVLLFTGLTAYDTQRLKSLYLESDGAEVGKKKAIMGAVTLYLDFINLFMFLLQFIGDRR